MRRRLATILTAALLGSALLLPLTAMPAVGAQTAVVLATEGAGSGAGLEPMPPDASENEFAPPRYEPNWTWRAGKVLLAVFLIIGAYLGLMYWLRVARPRQKSEQS
jgi:hypothetical protein